MVGSVHGLVWVALCWDCWISAQPSEEWTNSPQSTITSMQRRCVTPVTDWFSDPPLNPININPVFPCDALPLKGQNRAEQTPPHGEDECQICLTLTGCRWCVEGDLRAVGAEHGAPAASNSEGIQTVGVQVAHHCAGPVYPLCGPPAPTVLPILL